MSNFRFIDLFSGIGGFHQALSALGGECVLASDIDPFCNRVYETNYHLSSDINVRDLKEEDIPQHDVLCGGFPCQAFSKAGKQVGLEDKIRGTLFFEIVRILKYHHTKYIVLENVRNLVSHDHGNTWTIIQDCLKELGYRTTKEPLILSPHYFGVPQIRERVIILGKYDPENVNVPLNIQFEKFKSKEDNSIYSIVSPEKVDKSYYISKHEELVIQAWDDFYQGINRKVIGFPVWSEYFKYDGSFDIFPSWKADFIRKNITLYQENKSFIDDWFKKYDNLSSFSPTQRKFEYQAGTNIKSVWEGVIQFRPSGVRVKRPDCFQALVAMVQIPIIAKYKRRLTIEEAGKLQSFPMDNNGFIPDENKQQAYKQFGNSVNVEVIKKSVEQLFLN